MTFSVALLTSPSCSRKGVGWCVLPARAGEGKEEKVLELLMNLGE